jgi:two-component system sensor histidine kinase UhpB
MTLAARLIILVAGALLLSLLAGGLLILVGAARWVQAEVDTTAAVAHELIDQRLAEAAEETESRERLDELLQSLETGYHIRAVYLPLDQAAESSPVPVPSSALSRMLGVHPTVQEYPVAVSGLPPGRILLTIDPEPEVRRVWRAIEISLAAIGLFSATTLGLVAIGLSRTLRPLGALAGALTRVGAGDYSPRIEAGGPRELALLGRQFNLMADQLHHMRARTRALNAQMLAVRERERREIARDLHDELGPCLLAANLDVSALTRLSRAGDRPAVEECADGLAALLVRMQDLVRGIIERLHLGPADSVDLAAAVDELIAFWQERCPEIEWHTDIRVAGDALPPATATALVCVAREALTNAVRHGGARRIAICCTEEGPDLVLTVADDGVGLGSDAREGIGIVGMRSRVAALGGRLAIGGAPGEGTTIAVRLAGAVQPAEAVRQPVPA